jgi:peptidoglycan/LPS O-acetylase OafA/YrhL
MQIEGLNSLRFLAYFSVFLYHTQPFFIYGSYGVEFFFVLSSFLLTVLALNEIRDTGNFNKTHFFIRRSLRIYPLYFSLVLSTFILLSVLAYIRQKPSALPEQPWLYYFFLSNFGDDKTFFPLRFFWSVAIEEQYYLFFIICSSFFNKHLKLIILTMILTSTIYFLISEKYNWVTYNNLLVHFVNFSVGSLMAWLWHKGKLPSIKITISILLLSILIICLSKKDDLGFRTFLPISFGCVILITNYLTKYIFFVNSYFYKLTNLLGIYTYGLYMYSGFAIVFCSLFSNYINPILLIPITFVFNVGVAIFSYHFFESKFLKLKSKFKY